VLLVNVSAFWTSSLLGLLAGLANAAGGIILVRRSPSTRSLRYFVALGAGFMLSAAMLEMVPEGLALNARWGPVLLLGGYCSMHLVEHTLVSHFHFGEESHPHHVVSLKTTSSVLLGLAVHTFFDGIAIGSGFILSNWLGWIIFFAIFLHKVPEGFTVASVMLAGGRGRKTAFSSALLLGVTTFLGVLAINAAPTLVHLCLPLAAGVTIYVAASDLVPEVNREPGIRMALVFFGGVAIFLALRSLGPAT